MPNHISGKALNALRLLAVILVSLAGASLSAQTLTTLANFSGKNGVVPIGGLLLASDGNLYGTTNGGGTGQGEGGTIYKVTPGGTVTTLYNFCAQPVQSVCPDGNLLYGGLIQGRDGSLYGTTYYGGTGSGTGVGYDTGNGTIFKISLAGVFTTLYSFCAQTGCKDGSAPSGSLVQATDGFFYGTTAAGGAANDGTVFKISANGTLTTLYSFCSQLNCADGAYPTPYSGLIQATDGNFYGTTEQGGQPIWQGTIFRITAGGDLTTLYRFCPNATSCVDGAVPYAKLLQASDGNFYGSTFEGGTQGDGTIFRLTPDGTFTTLFNFCQVSCAQGALPIGALIQGIDGNLYGTTDSGGNPSDGTIFKMTLSGTLTTLYNFCSQTNCADGIAPYSGVTQTPDGNFYGTNALDGSGIFGSVYRFSLKAPTTVSLASSVNPSYLNQPVIFTATVQGKGVPTGTVAFAISGNTPVVVPLSNGRASFSWTFIHSAPGAVTASYSGDSNNSPSVSVALIQQVTSTIATTTRLVSSLNPSIVGQSVIYSATVTAQDGSVPAGTVTFTISGNSSVVVPLASGHAAFSWSYMNAGPRTVTANYSGNSTQANSSMMLLQTVNKETTQTVLTQSLNVSVRNQLVTFTARITGQHGGTPTGTVAFTISGNSPVSVPLNAGQSVFSWTFVNSGPRTVTATYSGDNNNLTSTSAPLAHMVN